MLLQHGGVAWGVSADWVEHLADINPIYRQGKLVVSEKIGGQVVSADLVADCLLYLFKLSKFSKTRWCGVGQSCRALVSSLSVGLYPFAILALNLKGSKETKLHGVKKLSDDIKWYAAVASIVTFVPEAFCVALAEDDRACRRLGELEAIVQEEVEFIFRIERFVWQRLALVANGVGDRGRAQECMPPSLSCKCFFLGSPSLLGRPLAALVADLGKCGCEPDRAARGRRADCHRTCVQEDSPTL